MTTATIEKPVVNMTVLNALRNRFTRQAAALQSQPEEDLVLASLAQSILSECVGRDDLASKYYASPLKKEEFEARAQEAIALLKILSEKVNEKVGASRTRRLLVDTILFGWVETYDPEMESVFARVLLALPRPSGTEAENQLGAAIREGVQNLRYDPSRLLRFLALAQESDNEMVIRRVFQTLGKIAKLPDLFFAAACLGNAGGSVPSKRIAPKILQYIRDMKAAEKAAEELINHGFPPPLPLFSYRIEEGQGYRRGYEGHAMIEGGLEIGDPQHVTITRYMPVPGNGLEESQRRVKEWLDVVAPEEIKKWRSAKYVKTRHTPGFEIKIVCILVKFVPGWQEKKDLFPLATLEHIYE